jgi:hypothetical protein
MKLKVINVQHTLTLRGCYVFSKHQRTVKPQCTKLRPYGENGVRGPQTHKAWYFYV